MAERFNKGDTFGAIMLKHPVSLAIANAAYELGRQEQREETEGLAAKVLSGPRRIQFFTPCKQFEVAECLDSVADHWDVTHNADDLIGLLKSAADQTPKDK